VLVPVDKKEPHIEHFSAVFNVAVVPVEGRAVEVYIVSQLMSFGIAPVHIQKVGPDCFNFCNSGFTILLKLLDQTDLFEQPDAVFSAILIDRKGLRGGEDYGRTFPLYGEAKKEESEGCKDLVHITPYCVLSLLNLGPYLFILGQ